MKSCSTTILTKTAADQGGDTSVAITGIHPDIIQAHILTRLDGSSLASTSCTSSQLNNLCSDKNLWKKICNSRWPSTTDPLLHDIISYFPSGHRSFFSDAYSTFHHPLCRRSHPEPYFYRSANISRLISAVDIHFEDKLICSRVIVTETTTSWFSCSPFRLDLLEPKEIMPTLVQLDGDHVMARIQKGMKLSWILIDPNTKRALNVSSMIPVEVKRHWSDGHFQATYAMVVPAGGAGGGGGGCGCLVQCIVVFKCGGKEGNELQLGEVSLVMEDMEGLILNGQDSLVILQEAMEEERRMRSDGEERERYDMFVKMRRELSVKQESKEKRLDNVCITTVVTLMIILVWMIKVLIV